MPELIRCSGPADGIATLTLNRPEKKNALSIALRDGLAAALDAAPPNWSFPVSSFPFPVDQFVLSHRPQPKPAESATASTNRI